MEYVSLITIVLLVLVAMSTYIRRGVQGLVRVAADQIGIQKNSEQAFDDSGHLVNSTTKDRSKLSKERRELLGVVNYVHDDRMVVDSFSFLNAGFTPR